jgi:hypothetical protein
MAEGEGRVSPKGKEILTRYLLEGSMTLGDAFELFGGEFDALTTRDWDHMGAIDPATKWVDWVVDEDDITLLPWTKGQFHAFRSEFALHDLGKNPERLAVEMLERTYGHPFECDPSWRCRISGRDLVVEDDLNEQRLIFGFTREGRKIDLASLVKKIL